MCLGNNIQYLRSVKNMTQEEMAEMLSVSRQTVSKWEMDQVYPEIPKLIKLSEIFNCKIDELLNKDMRESQEAYSEIVIKEIDGFRMGRYIMITPNPEDDVIAYMKQWAMNSGLNEAAGHEVPFSRAFELIPGAYKRILEYLGMNGFKENTSGEFLSCFEYVFEKEGVYFMEVNIHVDSVGQANLHTSLS